MAAPDPRIPGGWSGVRVHSARMDRPYVQLRSRIPEVMTQIAARTTEGTKDIADRIADGARERVPVSATNKHHLRDAIHVTFQGGGHLGQNLAEVGDWAVVAGDDIAWYGHIVENGSVRAAPHPFLLPAAEAQVPTIWATIAARLKNL